MKSIFCLTIDELENFLKENNEKKYRAAQIMDWLYIKRVNSFSKMTNLSHELIKLLEDNYYFDKNAL